MVDTLTRERQGRRSSCRPPDPHFHVVTLAEDDRVTAIRDVATADLWINGGFFVFRREIFDYIRQGEDLVEEPFRRLIAEDKLMAYPYDGFWAPMDTLKDKQHLEALLESGNAPWARWERNGGTAGTEAVRDQD